ncbi:MAG: beta-lactamase family protein [Acidobacteria bacterium]|nr:beta-lactamase family protein [Acidobacteriota bacterium]
MRKIILSVIFILLSLPISAQITSDQKVKIDALFKDANENTPGAAIGVIKDGKMIYSNGYGMADLEHDVKLSPKSVFYMASVSKQFVTMAVLLLEEQGKLSLDDEVQKHLPDFPRYDSPLTIRHFIHHTSGVRDNLTLWNLAGRDIYDHVDKEAIYEMIKRQKELNFKPGEKYLYSNSCYFMLAMMIEKISGMSIREFAEKNMFAPLVMKNTHFHDDQYHIVKNRAFSYAPGKDGFRNLIMRYDLVGSGGLYSNVEDMLLWDQNFYNNKLGKGTPDLITKMNTDGKLNNGKSAGYAFGVQNGTYKGLKTVSHSGALAGYRTHYVRFPDQNFSVVVLGNTANFRPEQKSYAIADIMIYGDYKASSQVDYGQRSDVFEPINLSGEELAKYSGSYWNNDDMESWGVFVKNGKLVAYVNGSIEIEMIPVGTNEFAGKNLPPGTRIKFEKADRGRHSFIFTQGGGSYNFAPYDPATYSAKELEKLSGTYFSEELNVNYELKIESGKLNLYIADNKMSGLTPIMKNIFRGDEIGFVTFEMDESGAPSGFKLDAGRVRNLRFNRP